MSSAIDKITCPKCGGCARREQNTHTFEVHTYCPECGFDSDDNDSYELVYEDDEPDGVDMSRWDMNHITNFDWDGMEADGDDLDFDGYDEFDDDGVY